MNWIWSLSPESDLCQEDILFRKWFQWKSSGGSLVGRPPPRSDQIFLSFIQFWGEIWKKNRILAPPTPFDDPGSATGNTIFISIDSQTHTWRKFSFVNYSIFYKKRNKNFYWGFGTFIYCLLVAYEKFILYGFSGSKGPMNPCTIRFHRNMIILFISNLSIVSEISANATTVTATCSIKRWA